MVMSIGSRRARLLCTGVVAASVAGGAGIAPAVASAGGASSARAGAYRYEKFTTTVHGKTCRRIGLHSINDQGAVLGEAQCGRDTAFVRGAGDHLTFRFTKDGRPAPTGISDTGAITGQTENGRSGAEQAWLRAPDGTLTEIDDPHSHTLGTEAIGVNARGTVVGFYYDRKARARGYEYHSGSGTYTALRAPARLDATNVVPLDIDDHGDVSGYYRAKGAGTHGFVIVDGRFRTVDAPADTSGRYRGTWVTSIGGPHLYAGVVMRGYRAHRPYQSGFVDRGGKFTRIAVPARWGSNTFVNGMNHSGELVGHYYPKSGGVRAFVAHP